MAAQAPQPPLITIEEYLSTSYRPDVEFIDGYLEEKLLGSNDHGFIQGLLFGWFLKHKKEWGVLPTIEMRTRVTADRVRLPDVIVDRSRLHERVLIEAPLLVIEVLSPDDTYSALQKRSKDYQAMGIPNIWLVDPDTRTARSCEAAFWIERERLEVEGTGIYLEVAALFRALDAGEPL